MANIEAKERDYRAQVPQGKYKKWRTDWRQGDTRKISEKYNKSKATITNALANGIATKEIIDIIDDYYATKK